MSRDEFMIAYARRSGVSVDWLRERRHAVRCDCGEDGCEGWAMVPLDWTNHRGLDGLDENWEPISAPREDA